MKKLKGTRYSNFTGTKPWKDRFKAVLYCIYFMTIDTVKIILRQCYLNNFKCYHIGIMGVVQNDYPTQSHSSGIGQTSSLGLN